MGQDVGQNEEIDRQLIDQLERLRRAEQQGELSDEEIMGAQRVLIETASFMRGHRPPATWDEAWELIDRLRKADRLRGPGGR